MGSVKKVLASLLTDSGQVAETESGSILSSAFHRQGNAVSDGAVYSHMTVCLPASFLGQNPMIFRISFSNP
jgi:hypothetical protein